MLGVTEDDALEWSLAGHIPYVEGPEREPRVRIAEEHSVDGPISSGFTSYSISGDPTFGAEPARRRREHESGTVGSTSPLRHRFPRPGPVPTAGAPPPPPWRPSRASSPW
jgi:hypothetical protein